MPDEVKSQANVLKEALNNINEGFKNVLSEVNSFADNDKLQGDSWKKLKEKASEYHGYIEMGMEGVQDSIAVDASLLAQSVGSEALEEDMLLDVIERMQAEIVRVQNMIDMLEAQRTSSAFSPAWNARINQRIAVLEQQLENAEYILKIYQEKLEFLYSVEDSTKGLFNTGVQLITAMGALINEAGVTLVGQKVTDSIHITAWDSIVTYTREMNDSIEAFLQKMLKEETGYDLEELKELYGDDVVEGMADFMRQNDIVRVEENSAQLLVEKLLTIAVGKEVLKTEKGYQYKDELGNIQYAGKNEIRTGIKKGMEIAGYINNLENSNVSMVVEKKETLVYVANVLLQSGYELSFVAGLLGNIVEEGPAGKFESSYYKKNEPPAYIKFINENTDYENLLSGKNISEVGIEETQAFLDDLDALVQNMSEEDKDLAKFGLGCIQWTGDRTKELLDCYREVCQGNNYPTAEQCMQAEARMFINEFQKDSGKIYTDYNAQYVEKESADKANDAGKYLCKNYVKPKVDNSKERGNHAENIYNIMENATE